MNIQSYLKNPMGEGSSVLMLKQAQVNLDDQFASLSGGIRLVWYSIGSKYLIAHLKIPSHSVVEMNYDVLVEFDIDTLDQNASVINTAQARVFSNCPSFIYTYAKVFDEQGNLIPWTKSLYQKDIFKKDPNKRNPAKLVGYERSLYLAFKYILQAGRNYKKKILLADHKVKRQKDILQHLRSHDEILQEYDRRKDQQERREKKEEKKKEPKAVSAPPKHSPNNSRSSKTTSKTSTIRKSTKIRTTKKIRKI